MQQDYVGLFNTPPTRTQVRIGLAAIGVLFILMAVVLVMPNSRLREIGAFVPMVDTTMLFSDLVTATLLFVKASVYRSHALAVLASGFVFMALLLVTHVLSYPGVFAPGGLLGAGVNTAAWAFLCRRAALPVLVIAYVLLRRVELSAAPGMQRSPPAATVGITVAAALAAAVTLLVTLGHDLLPSLLVDRVLVAPGGNLRVVNWVLIALTLTAFAVLFRQRRSVLDMWLLVVLVAALIQFPINMRDWSRFTVGFYAQWVLMPTSALVLMLALLAESSRLHWRLALATAARKRERDALQMSMDAVVAAFSHEIGQPLTAVTTNAKASFNYLTRSRPDLPRAIDALSAALDAGKDTVGVLKSLRGMVAREPACFSEFSVNDVARHVAELLDRELTTAKVSLELELDETLAPIQADRVQVQQVLTNLLVNAIEAVSETQDGLRRITVHSAPLDGRAVLIEVSDTGRGIPPGESERIFDTFVTTKPTGTGLGLSISRILAEEQGGHLWAAPANEHGATFCLQLPCIGAAVP